MSGIWVRFRYPNRQWGDPRWINFGRDWFFELRTKLQAAWRRCYGMKVPPGAAPKVWVISELDKMGVRLIGEDVIHLPNALYLTVSVASQGNWKTGPRGQWEVFHTILPTPIRTDPGLPKSSGRRP